ncbi:MxaD family protein [Gordonia alkanivorans]|uniref:SRPBCC family protein n=1 Tax=Gordonia alkanivorans TaxID=84096 RepID=UPI000FDE6242|nr:SRPBCC family protein [Gordonia alkanivorans]AZZ82452.1 MxaD family protein [Gordonia alkanivorans]
MTATFTLRQNLDCTPEAAWHLLTDPDQMCRWSTAPITPISLGPQDRPDTAGALRMVTLPGGRIRLREVVEYAEFPRTFRYRVYDGGPLLVEHRGEQRVVETSEGVEVQWTVDMTLFPRPLSHLMAWQIRREVQRSLTEMESLARDLDTATLTSPDELPRRTAHNLDDLVSSALEIRVLQQEIADELAGADDPKQWFARVYQYVTETMIEAATGRLELGLTHPDWVLALIPVFHRYYAGNLDAYRNGGVVEDAWQGAWSTCEIVDPDRPHEPVVKGLLAGVAAHIDADLPRALAALHLDRYPDRDLREFRPDYLRLAPVFTVASDRLLADLPRSHKPWWTSIAGRVNTGMRDSLLARTGYDVSRHRVQAFEAAVQRASSQTGPS